MLVKRMIETEDWIVDLLLNDEDEFVFVVSYFEDGHFKDAVEVNYDAAAEVANDYMSKEVEIWLKENLGIKGSEGLM